MSIDYKKLFDKTIREIAVGYPTQADFHARLEEFAPGFYEGLKYLEHKTNGVVRIGAPHMAIYGDIFEKETQYELKSIAVPVHGVIYSQTYGHEFYAVVTNKEIAIMDTIKGWEDFSSGIEVAEEKDRKARVTSALQTVYKRAIECCTMPNRSKAHKPIRVHPKRGTQNNKLVVKPLS